MDLYGTSDQFPYQPDQFTMRNFVLIALLATSISLGGCSFLAVKPPPSDYSPATAKRSPTCTKSLAAPVFDVVVATIGGVLVTAAIPEDSTNRAELAAGGLSGIALGTGAAYYGFHHSSACRHLDQQHRNANIKRSVTRDRKNDSQSAHTADSDETPTSTTYQPESDDASSKSESTSAVLDNQLSITWSLLDAADGLVSQAYNGDPGTSEVFLGPMWELMIEWNPTRHLGVAIVGGAGSATVENVDTYYDSVSSDSNAPFTRLRYGIQGLWYPLGDVDHGMQVGGLLHHARAFGLQEFDTLDAEIHGSYGPPVSRLTLAALLGYKVTTFTGFTLNAQAGPGVELLQGGALADGAIGLEDGPKLGPHLHVNLNLGWTF